MPTKNVTPGTENEQDTRPVADDHKWAESKFSAIKSGVTTSQNAIRELTENWNSGRKVGQFYDDQTLLAVAKDKFAGTDSVRRIEQMAQAENTRLLLTARGIEAEDMSERSLRYMATVDEKKWDQTRIEAIRSEGQVTERALRAEFGSNGASGGGLDYWGKVAENIQSGKAGSATLTVKQAQNLIDTALQFIANSEAEDA